MKNFIFVSLLMGSLAVWASFEFPANFQTEIKSYNESLPIID